MEINRTIAAKVLETVDVGLCQGKGEPVPGHMCVEAAVCFAMGLPHSDNPPCVGSAVRAFKIRLNDSRWSSKEARAKGMRQVAIAQLGSNEIDQQAFVRIVAEQTIRQIVPIALRAAVGIHSKAEHKAALEAAALRCAQEGTRESAIAAKKAAAAYAAYADAAYAYVANAAAYAADAYVANVANAAAYAANAAAYAANAAAYAANAAATRAGNEARDNVLSLAAKIAVDALIKLGAKGTEWLDLCA